ncbi:unnamed protein product [Linum tenue]|uniref:Secreted protein n=1 Tax=Linum tenue TaxID=586396 RepID=A0AAV0J621_9ROSI|nr:unnamed protein product [Linum tenue]
MLQSITMGKMSFFGVVLVVLLLLHPSRQGRRRGSDGGGGENVRVAKPRLPGDLRPEPQLCPGLQTRTFLRRRMPGFPPPLLLHQELLVMTNGAPCLPGRSPPSSVSCFPAVIRPG